MKSDSIEISKYIEDCYAEFGQYVNSARHIPFVFDGLKPVYRRVILAALDLPDKFIKTARLVGDTIGKYHPHGDASVGPVINNLVNNKILDGQGNHGGKLLTGEVLDAAAPRYTEVKLNDRYRKIISKLIKYVDTIDNALGNQEYVYIPTPIPFSLITGTFGIGVGIGVKIPPFTIESILEAYRHDDPYRLRANYGYEITEVRRLKKLWLKGEGQLDYSFKVYEDNSEDLYGTYIQGEPEIYFPNLNTLHELKDEGKVLIRDESTTTKKLFLAKPPRMRSITHEEIYNLAIEASAKSIYFKTIVYYKNKARPIGIRSWIDITYKNYINLINLYKSTNIENIKRDIILYNKFSDIAKLILEQVPYNDISNKLDCELDIVERVGDMPIKTIHKVKPEDKIKKLKIQLKEYKEINPDYIIDEFVYGG